MDSVDTHKNEAQERTPKINFVQRFFRKLIGYQEPTSYEEILEVITEVVEEKLYDVEEKLGNVPEIDYQELSYNIDYGNLSDYVDTYEVAVEMDPIDVAEYITLDYENVAMNIDYHKLHHYFIDGDIKDLVERLTEEAELIHKNFEEFYGILVKILKERKI